MFAPKCGRVRLADPKSITCWCVRCLVTAVRIPRWLLCLLRLGWMAAHAGSEDALAGCSWISCVGCYFCLMLLPVGVFRETCCQVS
jgi:hypothetical protein